MTIRNLEHLLAPTSVALVGASDEANSIGLWLARNLVAGGFAGPIQLVNPRRPTILGRTAVGSIAEIAVAPDLAVVATPPATIPRIVAELGARGTCATIVVTAGLDASTRQQMLDAARPHCLRILGPNVIGLMLPGIGLNASFSHIAPPTGDLAFLSQSGALITGILDWAAGRGIGFSHVVSLGDMTDVDFGDMLDYLAAESESRAILIYMEALTGARKFMSAARRAARVKPVVVVKSGRRAEGARAASSHTGALAGSDAVYDSAFRRAGLVRADDLNDLFVAAEMLSRVPRLTGERLAILTNGGGAGVLAADRVGDLEGTLAVLGEETRARLDAVLPANWSRANPVDIIGDADSERYRRAFETLLEDAGLDAILAINCPTAIASSTASAEVVAAAYEAHIAGPSPSKVLITNWLGEQAAAEARRRFAAAEIPSFETPGEAVRGFMHLVRYRRAQLELMRTPPAVEAGAPIDAASAARIIEGVLVAGRTLATEHEAKALLSAYGIPTVATRIAADPAEVARHAGEIARNGGQVVVKILSDDISHKSDVGGVALRLTGAEAARAAAEAMLERVSRLRPTARIRGFTVQEMVTRPSAHELIVGMSVDPTFGPTILFGAGGTAVEVVQDTSIALPPLDISLARGLIARTRIARLLAGYRDRPAADLDAIANAVLRTCELITRHPEIRELDINPLLADADGVIALDARVRLASDTVDPRRPMALRPYPTGWDETIRIEGVGEVSIRPIRPEDARLYDAFLARVTSSDMRLRFFSALKRLPSKLLARLTQIDYAREIAFVAVSAAGELLGVSRFMADPDYTRAEFGVLVRSDLKGRGLGSALMRRLVAYARAEQLRELYGSVLAENTTMLQVARELGFEVGSDPEEPSIRAVTLQLTP
ncbi:MAG: GNAT family N-acetyltransferase [Pseudomonadota bacterium]